MIKMSSYKNVIGFHFSFIEFFVLILVNSLWNYYIIFCVCIQFHVHVSRESTFTNYSYCTMCNLTQKVLVSQTWCIDLI